MQLETHVWMCPSPVTRESCLPKGVCIIFCVSKFLVTSFSTAILWQEDLSCSKGRVIYTK